jgi:hypothetical protein
MAERRVVIGYADGERQTCSIEEWWDHVAQARVREAREELKRASYALAKRAQEKAKRAKDVEVKVK